MNPLKNLAVWVLLVTLVAGMVFLVYFREYEVSIGTIDEILFYIAGYILCVQIFLFLNFLHGRTLMWLIVGTIGISLVIFFNETALMGLVLREIIGTIFYWTLCSVVYLCHKDFMNCY